MVETFFKSITLGTLLRNTLSCSARLNLSGATVGKQDAKPKGQYSSVSMGYTIRAAATHRWVGKAPFSHMQVCAVSQCLAFERKAA
jgi:hypothetical protein